MSAFLCSPEHISRVVNAAQLAPALRESNVLLAYLTVGAAATVYDLNTPQEALFNDLLQTNLDSLSARYPDAARISDWCEAGEGAYRYIETEKCATAVEAIKLLQSYRYQSCEHEGWEASLANAYVTRVISELICTLPGYETSPWTV